MSFNHNLFAGTEDLGLSEPGEAGAAAVLDNVAAEVSEIRADVAEINTELQEQGEAIDDQAEQLNDVVEASAAVEEAVSGMESMLASGNFDNKAFAALYNGAYRNCIKHLGGAPAKGASRLGAEDLYDASSATAMARDGMAGLMDRVKSAGTAVLEFIKRIYNWVVNFFIGLFNKNKKLIRRAELLEADLGKVTKLKEKVKLGKWNGYVDYAGHGLTGAKPTDLAEAVKDLGAYAALLDSEVSESGFKSAYGTLVKSMKTKIAAFAGNTTKKEGEKENFIAQIAGIRILFTSAEEDPTDIAACAKAARLLSLKTVKADTFSKLTSGEENNKLEKGALKEVLKVVVANLREMEHSKVDQKFAAAKRDKLIGHINAAGKDDDASKKIELVKAVCTSSANLIKTTCGLTSDFCEAYLDGVAASI